MHQAIRSLLAVTLLSFVSSNVFAAAKYSDDTVVASRGGASVTMLDVDAALLGVPERLRANVMNNPKRIDELVDRLLTTRQLAIEGQAAGLDKSAVFKRALQLQHDRLLSDQQLIDYRGKLDIGDVEELAQERYQVNPDAYAIPGNTSARHILIKATDRTDAEALKLATEIHDKAVAGADFVALVKEYSEDPSKASNDGLVPAADGDNMDPSFVAAVKELKKPSEISPVVKSQFGYHIIQLVQRMASKPRSFDQVKDKIVAELDDSMRGVRVKEHIEELKSLPIEAEPEIVSSLRSRYLPENASAAPTTPNEE